jgi:hypothetical protein
LSDSQQANKSQGRRGVPESSILSFVRLLAFLVIGTLVAALLPGRADALEAVAVPLDGRTLDLTPVLQLFNQADDRLQVSTAPGPDGIVRRIEVRSQ